MLDMKVLEGMDPGKAVTYVDKLTTTIISTAMTSSVIPDTYNSHKSEIMVSSHKRLQC